MLNRAPGTVRPSPVSLSAEGHRYLLPSLLLFLQLISLSWGCAQRKKQTPVPIEEISVGEPILVTGRVGAGVEEVVATYVLVDVRNTGDEVAIVGLGGELLDGADATLGPLRVESLRIGPKQRRLYALVDNKVQALSTAQSAAVRVHQAIRPPRQAPIRISMLHLYTDQGRAVVKGKVTNLTDAPVSAVVLASFYGTDDMPMMRQASLYKLDAHSSRSAQFVGPVGSSSGDLFVGETGP